MERLTSADLKSKVRQVSLVGLTLFSFVMSACGVEEKQVKAPRGIIKVDILDYTRVLRNGQDGQAKIGIQTGGYYGFQFYDTVAEEDLSCRAKVVSPEGYESQSAWTKEWHKMNSSSVIKSVVFYNRNTHTTRQVEFDNRNNEARIGVECTFDTTDPSQYTEQGVRSVVVYNENE